MMEDFTIFTGTANQDLAAEITRKLGVRLGACTVERFPDGEVSVRLDEPVRKKEVFIVQPTSPPVNEHLVELLAFADACRRADVRDRACLIIDDMISTGGTISESIDALLKAGARPEIIVAATHGLLLDGARDKLSHEAVREVFVTDTVSVAGKDWPQLKVISVAPLIAGAIRRFMADGSISDLF